jgi:hypothetical protein
MFFRKTKTELSKIYFIFERKGTLLPKDIMSLRLWCLCVFGKTPKTPKDEPDVFLM